jgi:hypothetical protein
MGEVKGTRGLWSSEKSSLEALNADRSNERLYVFL